MYRLACAAGWVPSEAAVKSHNHKLGAKGGPGKRKAGKPAGGRGRGGGSESVDGEGSTALWPPPSRETTYLHLNAMVPDGACVCGACLE